MLKLLYRCLFYLWRGVLDTTLCDKVCQRLVTGPWFSLGTEVSSNNKTDHHDITEILLKVTLNTITIYLHWMKITCFSLSIYDKDLTCGEPPNDLNMSINLTKFSNRSINWNISLYNLRQRSNFWKVKDRHIIIV